MNSVCTEDLGAPPYLRPSDHRPSVLPGRIGQWLTVVGGQWSPEDQGSRGLQPFRHQLFNRTASMIRACKPKTPSYALRDLKPPMVSSRQALAARRESKARFDSTRGRKNVRLASLLTRSSYKGRAATSVHQQTDTLQPGTGVFVHPTARPRMFSKPQFSAYGFYKD